MNSKSIALIGMMGAGKSTVARFLADRLGWPVVDLDVTIEQDAGCAISDIFTDEGESGFRRRETEALRMIIRDGGHLVVLATGGGTVISDENRILLREHFAAVWLDGSPDVLFRRAEGFKRPLTCGGLEDFRSRAVGRRPFYQKVAEKHVIVDDLAPEAVAEKIYEWWKGVSRREP